MAIILDGIVGRDEVVLTNLVGITFAWDSDWSKYSPDFVNSFRNPRVYGSIHHFEIAYAIGDTSIKAYLKKVGHWNKGLNIEDKWANILGAVDLATYKDIV